MGLALSISVKLSPSGGVFGPSLNWRGIGHDLKGPDVSCSSAEKFVFE